METNYARGSISQGRQSPPPQQGAKKQKTSGKTQVLPLKDQNFNTRETTQQ